MRIIEVLTTDNLLSPVAYTKGKVSNKELKRLLKKFKTDSDFKDFFNLPWQKVYSTKAQAKQELTEI